MSDRRRLLMILAVVALSFTRIPESYSMVDDANKIGPDMNLLEEENTYSLIPAKSKHVMSSYWAPPLAHQWTDKTGNDDHKDTTVGQFTKRYPQDEFSDVMPDIPDKHGKMRRGARKVLKGKALPEREIPTFLGDSKTSCLLPENGLTTAEIRCKLTPTFKICKSYCVFGYTYEEGIIRTSVCTYLENIWSKEFDECKPFIDCYLRMISPGSLKCKANEVESPPKCEIRCDMYEINDPVPKQNFTCNIDGSWDPFLPHCVEPTGGKIMAHSPADPEHGNILYP